MLIKILLTSLILSCSLHAHIVYNTNLRYECYKLIDLGETDVHQESLTRASFPVSLGPRINQKGHVIGNATNGGFIYDRVNPRVFLEHNGQSATVYDINNKGQILASVKYNRRAVEWLVWPYNCFCKDETLIPLDLKCLTGRDVHFRSINDKGVLVGSRTCYNGYKAIFYSPEKGVKDLSCAFLFEVNDYGNMAGYESLVPQKTPLLYHYKGGWTGFSDEPSLNTPRGSCITYQMDMAIASDNTLFGSFLCNNGIPEMYAYAWAPCEHYFKAYDLGGMQISAVNCSHTLVGTLGGEAVISNNMDMPRPLIQHVVEGVQSDMTLIEATDINDLGQIVGYGKWCGSLHLFLLDPIR